MVIRVTAMCVAVAMICSALRLQRPELATALSLAAGMLALTMLLGEVKGISRWTDLLMAFSKDNTDIGAMVLKGAGISILSELGAQLCADAGESALGSRIALASRVAILSLCAPLIEELTELIGMLLS